ncbi:hypothetical protein PG987_010349 [Apiospora arundinis]
MGSLYRMGTLESLFLCRWPFFLVFALIAPGKVDLGKSGPFLHSLHLITLIGILHSWPLCCWPLLLSLVAQRRLLSLPGGAGARPERARLLQPGQLGLRRLWVELAAPFLVLLGIRTPFRIVGLALLLFLLLLLLLLLVARRLFRLLVVVQGQHGRAPGDGLVLRPRGRQLAGVQEVLLAVDGDGDLLVRHGLQGDARLEVLGVHAAPGADAGHLHAGEVGVDVGQLAEVAGVADDVGVVGEPLGFVVDERDVDGQDLAEHGRQKVLDDDVAALARRRLARRQVEVGVEARDQPQPLVVVPVRRRQRNGLRRRRRLRPPRAPAEGPDAWRRVDAPEGAQHPREAARDAGAALPVPLAVARVPAVVEGRVEEADVDDAVDPRLLALALFLLLLIAPTATATATVLALQVLGLARPVQHDPVGAELILDPEGPDDRGQVRDGPEPVGEVLAGLALLDHVLDLAQGGVGCLVVAAPEVGPVGRRHEDGALHRGGQVVPEGVDDDLHGAVVDGDVVGQLQVGQAVGGLRVHLALLPRHRLRRDGFRLVRVAHRDD